ncbi:MAG: hemin-binding protein [Herminiimonas sp.]|nr:hemin-binding protein [Herminiimonas sp.]
MELQLQRCALAALLAFSSPAAFSEEHFSISRFEIVGNSLLSQQDIDAAVMPLTGSNRVFGDIQKALEALEVAYRRKGFSAVRVHVPEQELSQGSVRIEVMESRLANIVVSGNQHFDEANIRASLLPLETGKSPALGRLSEAIQLANDNPAKQVEVTLVSRTEEGKLDAKVQVTDSAPFHASATLDNSGTRASGRFRTGIALQNANLFGRDQVGTIAYTTSPDSPADVHVDLWSIGYRIPLYSFGDSIDFVYGTSSVNTPGSSPTLGGSLGIIGKGSVAGLRWNHFLPRDGNDASKLIYSLDRKYINSRCSFNGVEVRVDVPTPDISACVPYTVMPIGLSYFGRRDSPGQVLDFNIGVQRNLATGSEYTNVTGRADRYSYLTPGNRDTSDGFMTLRGGASLFKATANDWQLHFAGSFQVASDPLVSSEQFGLVGANAVRGFSERAVAADGGAILSGELYTPDLVKKMPGRGNLRLLAFYDVGRGYNRGIGNGAIPSHVSVASAGVGARYSLGKNMDIRADVARVNDPGTSVTETNGVWKAHLTIVVGL